MNDINPLSFLFFLTVLKNRKREKEGFKGFSDLVFRFVCVSGKNIDFSAVFQAFQGTIISILENGFCWGLLRSGQQNPIKPSSLQIFGGVSDGAVYV